MSDWNDVIRLPNSAIRQMKTSSSKDNQRSLTRVVFHAFKNLHQLLSDADQQLGGSSSGTGNPVLVVNSRVVSASVDAASGSSDELILNEPVRIRFQHLQKTKGALEDVVCVYWDLVRIDHLTELKCSPVDKLQLKYQGI